MLIQILDSDADPDFYLMRIRIWILSDWNPDADQDLACHPDADPVPDFQNEKGIYLKAVLRIHEI